MKEKTQDKKIDVWMVGSIGIDDIATRTENKKNLLGGSLPFATIAASFAGAGVGAVGVVGSDFGRAFQKRWEHFGIDLEGVQRKPGPNFRWACRYDDDMIERTTLKTELGVFADFMPVLPEAYTKAPFVLLGNIQPDLQLHVLAQARKPRFVALDSMNLWIDIARPALEKVIGKVDLVTMNDGEARQLTGKWNLRDCAAEILKMGPRFVLLKKGEHGAFLFTKRDIFIIPAYPVKTLKDPTGAGDTYIGAFIGCMAKARTINTTAIRKALMFASAMAAFCVEGFSTEKMERITRKEVACRVRELMKMTSAT
ncbi:MAG: PfkB family carbohydrate kinase [Kiritimatiellaeota bacterium]|nr:PfkB family carbohydrate kinase [Kiritimatiellota bacterium]